VNEFLDKLKKKYLDQKSISNYFDNLYNHILSKPQSELNSEELLALSALDTLKNERFVTFNERAQQNIPWPQSYAIVHYYTQGFQSSIKWKDNFIFKTVYDLSLFQMLLWELRPGCIVEIGSGNGSSAEFFRDLTKIYNLDTKIISFDNNQVTKNIEGVNFFYGDSNNPESFGNLNQFVNSSPTLFIEDAHVNVYETLKYLLNFAKPGDYFFIEDSRDILNDVSKILSEDGLFLDLHYMDFFGRSCSYDQNNNF